MLGQLGERPRVARAVGDRAGVVAFPQLLQRRIDRDHHRVVVAVVGPLDLEDHVAIGGAASQMDRGHRRLGAGVGEPPLRKAEAAGELLGHHDRAVGGGGEVGAEVDPRLYRRAHGRVGVADAHDAEAVVEVDVLVPVHVPDAGARAALDVHGPGIVLLERRGDALRHHLDGALVALSGGGGALRQLRHLPLGQRGDPRRVERGGAGRGGLDCHVSPWFRPGAGVARVATAGGRLRTSSWRVWPHRSLGVGRTGVSLWSGG